MNQYFERIGGLLELDFELHHGGSLAGSYDGGQGANGGDGLGQMGLFPPAVKLVDDTEGLVRIGAELRLRLRFGANSGLSLGQPVAGDHAVVRRSGLIVGRDIRV